MDNFLNFVYDDWDEVNDLPRPNKLSDYTHQDDNENTWVLSTQPMGVFVLTKIKNWKLSDVPNNPNAERIVSAIDRLRTPIKSMSADNQAKIMKYIQNLTKLSAIYISG